MPRHVRPGAYVGAVKYIIGRGQRALIPAYIAGDSGEFYFFICQELGELEMKKRLVPNKPFLAKATLEFVKYLTEEELEQIKAHGVKTVLEGGK